VSITSRRAQIAATAHVTTTVQAGQVFAPMHYGLVNQLTFPSFDPHSRQPSYKACAVAVARLG
jgi:assimilatory nitrate reductase catalytic subunit